MDGSEIHVQAGIWQRREHSVAGLFMEGEARDRSNGGGIAVDALFRVVLAGGLRFTTDLDHFPMRPVPGWRVELSDLDRVTLVWPRFHPLLDQAPLDLPPGWRRLTTVHGFVVVFAGYGFGLHEHAADGYANPAARLTRVAESGALAAGAVLAVSAAGHLSERHLSEH